jgi:hypothetical protein
MKHATTAALAKFSGLLEQIRIRDELKEKKLGIFYRKSKSFLHFHKDPRGYLPISVRVRISIATR